MRTIAILFIASLVLVGCNDRSTINNASCPWIGGGEGIFLEIENIGMVGDSGYFEVWEDEAFPLSIRLKNYGEYSIPAHEVKLEIKGVSASEWTGIDFTRDNGETIERTSEYMPDGGEVYVTFGDAQFTNLQGPYNDAQFHIFATYQYETHIEVPQVCYKDDNRQTQVCDVNAVKVACASGGPFQVGSVVEKYYGKGRIALEIPVYNIGRGRSIARQYDQFRDEWDEFTFEATTEGWVCTARGNPAIGRISYPMGQRNSERLTMLCRNDQLEEGALYVKSFHLIMRYWYQDWVHQVVRIKENPE